MQFFPTYNFKILLYIFEILEFTYMVYFSDILAREKFSKFFRNEQSGKVSEDKENGCSI